MQKFRLDPSNPPRLTPEQQARLDAMTDEEITAAALSDPDNPPLTDEEIERGKTARRVSRLRERLGLSQSGFSIAFRIPLGTLRDWEQGRSKPDGPSLAYITVIERDPEAVTKALTAA